MSEPIRDGGTAFPAEYERRLSMPANPTVGQLYPTSEHVSSPGMSLRDYFAAHALPAIISSIEQERIAPLAAQAAYVIADAMLAERAK